MEKLATEIKVHDTILFEASKDVRKEVRFSESFYFKVEAIGKFPMTSDEIFFLSKNHEIYIVKTNTKIVNQ